MSLPLRNIAIIAHVDHGKTTLVDELLKQSGSLSTHKNYDTRVMDSNDLERERGITILAKNTAVDYKGVRINIVDTPGHADFGGEVERIMNMVDGVLLLVDAYEGPMPQTKFVTAKALALGLQPIVVINKVDRPHSEPEKAIDLTFDLFASLGANDEQLDFPVVYASAKNGYAMMDMSEKTDNMICLFDTILEKVSPPEGDTDAPLQMLSTTLDWDDYLGRIVVGRVANGHISVGQSIVVAHKDGKTSKATISKLLGFEGLARVPVESAQAGEIVCVAGIEKIDIGETICDPEHIVALPSIEVDKPTLHMEMHINNSPLAGKEGKYITTRQVRDRLFKEVRTNVSMQVEETDAADIYKISARGELQICILLENMRREGFEMAVSRPQVIVRRDENGKRQEPYENVTIDVDAGHEGSVIEKLGKRGGEMQSMDTTSDGRVRLEFLCPTRGLIGYGSEFLTDTRGTGIMNHVFHAYGDWITNLPERNQGVLISMGDGDSVAYALWKVQERGRLFIGSGVPLYEGMVIGTNSRDSDMIVNAVREKKLTNVRSSGKDDAIRLVPPMPLTLERAIEFIGDDELVEITPTSIRLRKRLLKEHERKRASSSKKKTD